MRYEYKSVKRIPQKMANSVVYHTEDFELAGLLCACGCGHRVMLIVPDSHQVRDEGGYATISPSIGVLDAPCKSHFFIRCGNAELLPAFTAAHASDIMQRQVARHLARDARTIPRWLLTKNAVLGWVKKIWTSFFR